MKAPSEGQSHDQGAAEGTTQARVHRCIMLQRPGRPAGPTWHGASLRQTYWRSASPRQKSGA